MEHLYNKCQVTAAILAGGKNSRFGGKTKAKMMIDGRPLIENTIRVLETVFDDIIIITNRKDELPGFKNIRMYADIYHNRGPLGGLHSALTNSQREAVFMLASDMPDISAGIIRRQLADFAGKQADALLPRHDNFIEPLHAVYRKSILPGLDKYLDESQKLAIREFLKQVSVDYFSISNIEKQNVFININTQEDLNNYLNT